MQDPRIECRGQILVCNSIENAIRWKEGGGGATFGDGKYRAVVTDYSEQQSRPQEPAGAQRTASGGNFIARRKRWSAR